MRPQIQSIADGLLEGIAARGGGDLVAEYAFPLPMEVVRLLFGVDAGEWAANVTRLFDPATVDSGAGAPGPLGPMGVLAEWFVGVVEARRLAPGDDMFSAMIVPDEDGDALSTDELVANAVLLVTAGFETTMSLIALTVYSLLTHPDQLAFAPRGSVARPERGRGDAALRTRRVVDDTMHALRSRGGRRHDPRGIERPLLGGRVQP